MLPIFSDLLRDMEYTGKRVESIWNAAIWLPRTSEAFTVFSLPSNPHFQYAFLLCPHEYI
jgi:hypothetical protein